MAVTFSFNIHGSSHQDIAVFYHQTESSAKILHGHEFYEIFLVINGSADHLFNRTSQRLCRGMAVFIQPGDVHQYSSMDKNFSFYNVAFTKEIAQQVLSLGGFKAPEDFFNHIQCPVKMLSSEITDKGEQLLKHQVETVEPFYKKILSLEILMFLAGQFLVEIPEKRKLPQWLSELLIFIQKDNRFLLGVSTLYSNSGRSREHVSRCFKQFLGVSPTEYINQKKITYGANLLMHTNLDLFEIGQRSGFSSHSHFYHLFKAQFGVSPGHYRKAAGTNWGVG